MSVPSGCTVPAFELVNENGRPRRSPLNDQCSHVRHGKESEHQPALFALANPDFLFRGILIARLRDLYDILLRLKIGDAQLPASGFLWKRLSVKEYARLVLPRYHYERADVLSGFNERVQRRRSSNFDCQFVLLSATADRQLMSTCGHRRQVSTFGRNVDGRLPIQA